MQQVQLSSLDPSPPFSTPSDLPNLGVVGNVAHQEAGPFVFADPAFSLLVVEFDDQGCVFDDGQMDAVRKEIAALAGHDANIFVFVHGWKHDARTLDTNLQSFKAVLAHLASQQPAAGGVPIIGVYVGWRGLSLHGFGLENLTFWDRKQAGLRVASGSVRELFGRLRHFRAERKRVGGSSLLAIIGHSFGGMVVYFALAQSLIESATAAHVYVEPSFADLVLLVNPAFEGVRYLPIQRLVEKHGRAMIPGLPIFVSVTSQADWATRFAFPLGCLSWLLTECTKGKRQRQALINTMGHIPWMQTHRLSAGPAGTVLTPLDPATPNLFWVVEATKAVINDHNDIFNDRFVGFVKDLLLRHIAKVQSARRAG